MLKKHILCKCYLEHEQLKIYKYSLKSSFLGPSGEGDNLPSYYDDMKIWKYGCM